jgi:hypothetical protein
MSKTFRGWKIDEPVLLPLTEGDFVAEDHLARLVHSGIERQWPGARLRILLTSLGRRVFSCSSPGYRD